MCNAALVMLSSSIKTSLQAHLPLTLWSAFPQATWTPLSKSRILLVGRLYLESVHHSDRARRPGRETCACTLRARSTLVFQSDALQRISVALHVSVEVGCEHVFRD
ncbi:hypothetical protein IWZ00DRAFT_169054 [Phyllosticta capitalensis]